MTTTSRISPEQKLIQSSFGESNPDAPIYGDGIINDNTPLSTLLAERIAWEISTTIDPGASNTQLRRECSQVAKVHGPEVAHALWRRIGLLEHASPYRPTNSAFETIKQQAIGIAECENEKRISKPVEPFKTMTSAEFVKDYTPPVGMKPIKAWAQLAAPMVSFDEWSKIVDHCDEHIAFRGDVVRFFETAFEGLQTADGHVIVP